MSTREEKLHIIERLKTEVNELKNKIEEQEQVKKSRSSIAGTLMRTGIVFLIMAAGICIAGYYLL